jgi:hypothetical protein
MRDSGLVLDGRNAAHSGSRLQILATGLGKVRPDWPTGWPRRWRIRRRWPPRSRPIWTASRCRSRSAALAPGYIGFYLIEVQLPALVNAGPAELYITADGQESNRCRWSTVVGRASTPGALRTRFRPKMKKGPTNGGPRSEEIWTILESRPWPRSRPAVPWAPASPRTLPPRLHPGNGSRSPGWPKSVRTRHRRCLSG